MKIKLFLLFFIIFTTTVNSQQPVSVHLTEKEGLPDKEFYDIIEDNNGLIWLAADKGLFSYDGNTYKSHTHQDQIGLSVFSLTKDAKNKVWFTNLANQIFYIEKDKVQLFTNVKEYFKGNLVTLKIHNHLLIVSTIHKLLIFDLNTNKIVFKKITKKDSYFNSFPLIKNDSIFFVNGDFDITIIDKSFNLNRSNKKVIKKIKHPISGFGTFKEFKNEYFSTFNTTTGSLINFKIDFKKSKTNLITDLPKGIRIHHLEIIENSFFYGTNRGIFVCELKDNKIKVVQHLLPNTQATKILKDSLGNLWITTLKRGLFIIPNLKLKTNFETTGFNGINRIYKGKFDELFLIGNNKEIYRFSYALNQIDTIPFKNVSSIKYFFYNPNQKKYFIKLSDNNLSLFDLQKKHFILKKRYSSEIIKDHQYINEDEFLLTTNLRISKAILSKKEINFKLEEKIRGYVCYYHKKTKESYFATVDGLFAFDENFNKSIIKYNDANIYIKEIVSTDNGDIWCLSFKNGIYKISNNKVVAHYTTKNGLLTNTNSFIKQHNNSIWIAGEKGIQNLDIKSNTFRNLTQKDGIPSYNFTGLEVIENNVYIATQKELFSFNSKTVFDKQSSTNFQPYFTSIIIDDKNQPIQSNYKVPNDNQKITIVYNTNGFLSSENNTYKYRLFDTDEKKVTWQTNTSQENVINYNRLSEGEYTFQLKAINSQNESEIKEIKFSVAGIFYEQWWFYASLTLGLVSLFYVYINKQKNRFQEKQILILEKQNKELENVFLKLESLRSQMNPHFVFNALNSIQDYIINNQKNLAADYLGKFADLIRMYLDQSAKKEITLSEEIETLSSYLELEKLRFEEKLTYKIEVAKNVQIDEIKIPTILVQPYVENALKHGLLHKKTNGKLSVEFSLNNTNCLVITVTDNGVGREKSSAIKAKQISRHKSFATKATKNRLELLNYNKKHKIEISIENLNDKAEDVGTKVTIKIPLEKDTLETKN